MSQSVPNYQLLATPRRYQSWEAQNKLCTLNCTYTLDKYTKSTLYHTYTPISKLLHICAIH